MGSKNGFTLIEILIVIALIGLIMSVAVPNATLALKVNISNSSRELATTIRTSYDEAVLKGLVYRIAFDIEARQYWVEQGEKNFLALTYEQEEAEQKKLARMSEEDRKNAQSGGGFVLAKNVTSKKRTLPKGVNFKDVLTSRSPEPITAGVAYAHVFPHGFVERLIIHLKDDYDRESTLFVNPVSGKSKVFERYVKNEDETK